MNWNVLAQYAVALLRAEVGRNPTDPVMSALIAELSDSSASFRAWWAEHEVRPPGHSPPVCVRHAEIGEVCLTYEAFEATADRSSTICLYIPEPGSPAECRLFALANAFPAE